VSQPPPSTSFPTLKLSTQHSASMSNPQLSNLCKAFHLARSGNKAKLIARLQSFSADRSKWDRCLSPSLFAILLYLRSCLFCSQPPPGCSQGTQGPAPCWCCES
jgi:hypothetical protein